MLSVTTDPGRRTSAVAPDRKPYARIPEVLPIPNLIELQLNSFHWFIENGLRELLDEISPIQDFTSRVMELRFREYEFEKPKYSALERRTRDLTYSKPLYVWVELLIKETGEIQRQRVYMGDFPFMTNQGTFIINGAERVVVSQLVRSPGVYYTAVEDPATGRNLFNAKVIPNRGAWLEFETAARGQLYVKVDRKRKLEATKLLRAVGYESNDEISALFSRVDVGETPYIASTLDKDSTNTRGEALIEVYKKLRPGDPPTGDNAEKLVESLFFNFRRYDLGRVGRYKLNKKLTAVGDRMGITLPTERTISKQDIAAIVGHLIELNNGLGIADDIDHLGNRRIRANGELIQNAFRVGLLRMERVVRERMSIQEAEKATPNALINIRPVVAAMKEFFGGSQLSQFMDQTNPLAELTSKRRLSALGPGGLSRERAGFDVRDVHHSHYGRICPIETPEGPNIGLIGSLATYGRINDYGFIETPYRKVVRSLKVTPKTKVQELVGRMTTANSVKALPAPDGAAGKALAKIEPGTAIDEEMAGALVKAAGKDGFDLAIQPYVTDEISYLPADEEESYIIAQANTRLDENNNLVDLRVAARFQGEFRTEPADRVDMMDVSPKQIMSVAASLIPFLEHDDANRALMGANMQRQAVPLLQPESPLVATGVEAQAARDSGQVLLARVDGTVVKATAGEVVLLDKDGQEHIHQLRKFVRSNQGTCISHRPIVLKEQQVKAGQVIADTMSTENGELALGQNVLCAFMFWEGGNFEDAILLSERLVQEDKFTSIHIEKYEVEARDTKLGPEEITRDIPNVGEDALKDLDDEGIIYVGAEVRAGDILVGKITPKGETELTAEERLLRAIFGEKAREVKDTSLRVPSGEYGKVVDVKKFSRDDGDELPPGVNQMVRVSIAVKRKLTEGDKMAGRHGNKGVIAKVLPVEDMPYLADGTPVDIILSPLGAPSRMNVGTILETHLGWAAHALGLKVATPVFDSASEREIEELLEQAGLPASGKATLFDGRTGEPFERPVCVGYVYLMKLHHLVEDKVHARSTGPYSLITQQPLGGKAQFGGQRFGEMEVWALEAYGAANILQELLTVKSDDIVGRVKTYEAIVKGEKIQEPGVPESFKVLVKELQSLGLNVEVLNENEEQIQFIEDSSADALPELGINLEGLEDRD